MRRRPFLRIRRGPCDCALPGDCREPDQLRSRTGRAGLAAMVIEHTGTAEWAPALAGGTPPPASPPAEERRAPSSRSRWKRSGRDQLEPESPNNPSIDPEPRRARARASGARPKPPVRTRANGSGAADEAAGWPRCAPRRDRRPRTATSSRRRPAPEPRSRTSPHGYAKRKGASSRPRSGRRSRHREGGGRDQGPGAGDSVAARPGREAEGGSPAARPRGGRAD